MSSSEKLGNRDILPELMETYRRLRAKTPLIHYLTNYVTANDCANITLAAGASPVMASAREEVEEIVSLAGALVLNIGTISSEAGEAMLAAGKKAASLGIPVILDPVGVGASSLRTAVARRILDQVPVSVIRGNMSEIKVLAGCSEGIRGVDSTAGDTGGQQAAAALARRFRCVVAVTGKTDMIVRGGETCRIDNGDSWLAGVTGTGCMATALTGCCCGAGGDPFFGAVTGVAMMGIAGEMAKQSLRPEDGSGTFRVRLFDAISRFTPETFRQYGKISYRREA